MHRIKKDQFTRGSLGRSACRAFLAHERRKGPQQIEVEEARIESIHGIHSTDQLRLSERPESRCYAFSIAAAAGAAIGYLTSDIDWCAANEAHKCTGHSPGLAEAPNFKCLRHSIDKAEGCHNARGC